MTSGIEPASFSSSNSSMIKRGDRNGVYVKGEKKLEDQRKE